MTDIIALPGLLAAIGQEAGDLATEVQTIEQALLPVLLPALAGRAELAVTLQRIDPLLQRLVALSRVAETAASEVPPLAMPATTACLRDQRLASLLRDLQPPVAKAMAATVFDPLP
jgi:hypothetical protein